MKEKKWVKHLPIYFLELVILIAAGVALYLTTIATDVEKVELNEDDITVNEEVVKHAEEIQETQPGVFTGVKNIALFGVDARDRSLGKGNRSDSIMICSIDMDVHEVRLISLYRDTYLNLGNDSYNKCNSAYACGGPEQAISMINMNMDLFLTDYVTVGFEGLIKAVDSLGGIELDVTDAEITHLNNYQTTMAEELGMTYTPVTVSGRQNLNGLQATAYCRIRYTQGDDFKRAERQRTVIEAMIEKSKTASLPALTKAAESVLPYVSTSLDVEDILAMLGVVGDYKVVLSDGFPFENMRNGGTIGTKGSCVVPTSLEDNVVRLHELLYNEKDYQPSKALISYSNEIQSETKDYLMY